MKHLALSRIPWRPLLEVAVLTLLLLLAGCFSPKESRSSSAVNEAGKIAAERSVKIDETVTPQPHKIHIDPKSGEIDVEVPQPVKIERRNEEDAEVSGSQKDSEAKSESSTWPLGAKLIMLGMGLFIVLGAIAAIWMYFRNTSIGAAVRLADSAAAKGIELTEEEIRKATSDKEIAAHALRLAAQEKARGKLHARK